MVVGLPGSESTMVRMPVLVPELLGVKLVVITQLLEPARDEPQVEDASLLNSEFEYVKLVKVMAVVPVLVSVRAALVVLVLPTVVLGKVKLLAEKVNLPTAARPTPENRITVGLAGSE